MSDSQSEEIAKICIDIYKKFRSSYDLAAMAKEIIEKNKIRGTVQQRRRYGARLLCESDYNQICFPRYLWNIHSSECSIR